MAGRLSSKVRFDFASKYILRKGLKFYVPPKSL